MGYRHGAFVRHLPDARTRAAPERGQMTPSRFLARSLLAAFAIGTPLAASGQVARPSRDSVSVRVVSGIGASMVHLPAFTYTRGQARTPVVEPAQEGGGPTFAGGLEARRGRVLGGARYLLVLNPLANGWSANVGAFYAGLTRIRPGSALSAAVGTTVVRREQVTRTLAPNLCLYPGCEDSVRVNNDGGTLMTFGALLTVSAERRFGDVFGVGVEGFAASGPQRYAGAMLRFSVGQH